MSDRPKVRIETSPEGGGVRMRLFHPEDPDPFVVHMTGEVTAELVSNLVGCLRVQAEAYDNAVKVMRDWVGSG